MRTGAGVDAVETSGSFRAVHPEEALPADICVCVCVAVRAGARGGYIKSTHVMH